MSLSTLHADTQARNVLIDSTYKAKVADFGFTQSENKSTESENTQVPVRRAAPCLRLTVLGALVCPGGADGSQVLHCKRCLELWHCTSDCSIFILFFFSFTLFTHFEVLFEIYTYGEKPYKDWSNGQVWMQLQAGYRLPAPIDCPPFIYELMRACWQEVLT
jgi:hypothetical protein